MRHGWISILVFLLPFLGAALFGMLVGFLSKRDITRIRNDKSLKLSTTRVNRRYNKEFLHALLRIETRNPTPADQPPLAVGEKCNLVHVASPVMLVVDANDEAVIASWDNGCQEHQFARTLVRRHRSAEIVRPGKWAAS